MIEIFSAIDFIAADRLLDRLGRSRPRPWPPLEAICSVWRLFSAFCVIEALICSSDDVVSSTEAACSQVPWERDWAVLLTWSEAADSPAAERRTSPTTMARRSTMIRIADRMLLSFCAFAAIDSVRSPSDTRRATSAAYSGSPPSCRVTERVTSAPAVDAPTIARRKTSAASRVALP